MEWKRAIIQTIFDLDFQSNGFGYVLSFGFRIAFACVSNDIKQ